MTMIGKIKHSFWHDGGLRGLSQNGRYLALYLLSCPHGNSLGVFRLPEAYALDDLQWDGTTLVAAMDELKGIGFVDYCGAGGWVSLLGYQQIAPAANGKQLQGRIRLLEKLPPMRLNIEPVVRHLSLLAGAYLADHKAYRNRIEAAYIRYTGRGNG